MEPMQLVHRLMACRTLLREEPGWSQQLVRGVAVIRQSPTRTRHWVAVMFSSRLTAGKVNVASMHGS